MKQSSRYFVLAVLAVSVSTLSFAPTSAWAQEAAATGETPIAQSLVKQLLLDKSSVLEEVFGTVPTEHQEVGLPDGDIVVLVHGGSRPDILLFRVDQSGEVVWDEEVASIRTDGYKVRPRVIADEAGGCFVLWTQPPPEGLLVRHLSDDGAVLWTTRVSDQDVFSYDVAREASGALIIAASNPSVVRAFRVELDGTLGWTERTLTLSTESSAHNPVSLITTKSGQDGVAVWYGGSDSARGGRSFVAQRFGLGDGKARWMEPAILGPAPDFTLVVPRKVDIRAVDDGVEASLYRGEAGDAEFDVHEYKVRLALDGSAAVLEEEQFNADEG